MKKTIAAITITLALALVGCQSEADHRAEIEKARRDSDAVADAALNKLEANVFDSMIHLVALDQGESAGMHLLLDCQQKGYRIHTSNDGVVTGYTTETMSNRHKAECDAIIATENRIRLKRDAREKAEEKRKDDAYDRAHK